MQIGQRQLNSRPVGAIIQSRTPAHRGGRGLATNLPVAESPPIEPVQLNWLDRAAPAVNSGVSFGVPWPRGVVTRQQAFSLAEIDGRNLPLQSWPLAYWPDGSIKWSGFATVASPQSTNGAGGLKLSAATGSMPAGPTVQVRQSDTGYEIDTGAEGNDGAYARPDRLAAYVYMKTRNPAFAQKALTALTRRRGNTAYETRRIEGPDALKPIDEALRVGTNGTAQSSLVAIEILEMCKDQLPKTMPPQSPPPNRPPGGRLAGAPTPPSR